MAVELAVEFAVSFGVASVDGAVVFEFVAALAVLVLFAALALAVDPAVRAAADFAFRAAPGGFASPSRQRSGHSPEAEDDTEDDQIEPQHGSAAEMMLSALVVTLESSFASQKVA